MIYIPSRLLSEADTTAWGELRFADDLPYAVSAGEDDWFDCVERALWEATATETWGAVPLRSPAAEAAPLPRLVDDGPPQVVEVAPLSEADMEALTRGELPLPGVDVRGAPVPRTRRERRQFVRTLAHGTPTERLVAAALRVGQPSPFDAEGNLGLDLARYEARRTRARRRAVRPLQRSRARARTPRRAGRAARRTSQSRAGPDDPPAPRSVVADASRLAVGAGWWSP